MSLSTITMARPMSQHPMSVPAAAPWPLEGRRCQTLRLTSRRPAPQRPHFGPLALVLPEAAEAPAARSSSAFASWRRATSSARCNQVSASAGGVPGCRRVSEVRPPEGGKNFQLPHQRTSCCSTRVMGFGQQPGDRLPGGPRWSQTSANMVHQVGDGAALPRWARQRRSPGGTELITRLTPGPAWPAPSRASSFPEPLRVESPARSRVRRRPLRARARPTPPGETATRRSPNTAPTPGYRDVTARVPTLGHRGGGPGLAPGARATRGSERH